MTGDRVLVAGIGNVFLSDDGFGVEVAGRLAARGGLPAGVEVADIGIRGVHLAYRLLDGYRGLLLVDTVHRDGPPGTLYRLEHSFAEGDEPGGRDPGGREPGGRDPGGREPGGREPGGIELDGHDMNPDVVLGLLRDLAAATDVGSPVGRVLVLGCEPARMDEGIGLSEPVAAAVPPALVAVDDLVELLLAPIPEGARP
ncbi:hydrogenase maturation protease [Pseudonocardia nantongensis]|uniref:hydrogenase maturation protease n=1 Tax=Pseudonocardia nantongensis TaxID=1181885 RepID=UPI00397A066B